MTDERWDGATHAFWHGSAPMNYVLRTAGPQDVLVRGEGCEVVDRSGRRFLDARAGIANMMLGYSRDDVVDAMCRQARELPFVCTLRYETPAQVTVDYAQELAAAAPAGLTRVRFTHTGSAAVESALHMARRYHANLDRAGRHTIVGLHASFHGSTLMTMAAAGQPMLHAAFAPMPPGFAHVPAPDRDACPACRGEAGGREVCAEDMIAALDALDPSTVAAVLVEPVKGLSGVPLPSHWLRRVREYCTAHDIVLVFDEVFSGFGRVGPMFAAELSGVTPDVLCLSKGITAGYATMGAVLVADHVYEAFDLPGKPPFGHGSSTDAHPVSCAAGLAVLRAYRSENVLEAGQRAGRRIAAALGAELASVPRVRAVRNTGGFVALELDDETGAPASMPFLRHIQSRCHARDVLVDYTPDILMIVPPLVIDDGAADRLVAAVAEVVATARETDVDTGALRPPSVSGRR